jgi:hypothetical protein
MRSTLNFLVGLSILSSVTACTKSSDSKSNASTKVSQAVRVEGVDPSLDSSQKCIISACGEKDPLAHPFESDPTLETKTRAMIESTLKKPLENYMGRVIHQELIVDGLYKKLFAAKDQITVSPEKLGLIQSFYYVNQFNKYISAATLSPQGKYIFDAHKLEALFGAGHEAEVQAFLTLNDLLEVARRLSDIFSKPYEIALQSISPGKTLKEAQIEKAQLVGISQIVLYNQVPALAALKTKDLVVEKALTGVTLSYSEQISFLKKVKQAILQSYILDSKVQTAFAKVPFNSEKFLTEFELAYSEGPIGKAMAKPQTLKTILKEGVELCSSKLAYSYAALPTQAQIEEFKNIVAKIQTTAQSMMEEKTKASLPQPFKAEVLYPEARENLIATWTGGLQTAIANRDAMVRNYKTLDISDKSVLDALLIFAASRSADEKVFGDVFEFCDEAYAPKLNDSALYGSHMINISWPTVTHPEQGAGIVAHEFGHIVSHDLPENLLKPEKSCLQNQQGTELYVEEDFADLFASTLMKRLNYKIANVQTQNFACGLNSREGNGWKTGSVKNEEAADPHSSGLYRLLAIADSTTGLTSQCSDYLASIGDKRFSRYCTWEK